MSPIPKRYFLQPYSYSWQIKGDPARALKAVNKVMAESGFLETTEEFLCSEEYRQRISMNNGKPHLILTILTTPGHRSSLDTTGRENNLIELGKVKEALKEYLIG